MKLLSCVDGRKGLGEPLVLEGRCYLSGGHLVSNESLLCGRFAIFQTSLYLCGFDVLGIGLKTFFSDIFLWCR